MFPDWKEQYPSVAEVNRAEKIFRDYVAHNIEFTKLAPGSAAYTSLNTVIRCACSKVYIHGKMAGIERALRNEKMAAKNLDSADQQGADILQEINYVLRRNYNAAFLRSVLTRILILEKARRE